jgi:hypothetical protein
MKELGANDQASLQVAELEVLVLGEYESVTRIGRSVGGDS